MYCGTTLTALPAAGATVCSWRLIMGLAVHGPARVNCRLTIHSSRRRFAARLNSGVSRMLHAALPPLASSASLSRCAGSASAAIRSAQFVASSSSAASAAARRSAGVRCSGHRSRRWSARTAVPASPSNYLLKRTAGEMLRPTRAARAAAA